MELIPKEQFMPAGDTFLVPEQDRPTLKGTGAWGRFRKNKIGRAHV